MKKILFTALAFSFFITAYSQSVIFLHHSTGGAVYNDGDVPEWISDYNTENNKSYQIAERSYPNSPYAWNNYPYDYWLLWVDDSCKNEYTGIECLDNLCSTYDVVIWKHCYPGAGIIDSDEAGNVASSTKTLANYKEQYRALRTKMGEYPNTRFIVWTLAPLHRLASNSTTRQNANEFVQWVKNDWLTEDDNDHPNIFIFDFFGQAAEMDENPSAGEQYALKYDYEGSHTSSDSHPNKLANETIGPVFAQFIVDVIEDKSGSNIPDNQKKEYNAYPNPTSGLITIEGIDLQQNEVQIFDILGQRISDFTVSSNNSIDISGLRRGFYILKIDTQIFRIAKE